ncbi:MAG: Flp pilus assembly complex ATPase component TadA [Fibrella sp.]|nr:Flp pilus assembly complex ATPase component TadA [Armatimonadota bacterium]
MTPPIELIALFDAALAKGASDMHILAGASPRIRVYGDLLPLPEQKPLTATDIEELLLPLFPPSTKNGLQEGIISSSEILSTHSDFNFVVYVFRSAGTLAATVRILSAHVPTLAQVGYDCLDHFKDLAKKSSGLILITGPVGCGKQTTAFALLQEINASLPRRIHLLEESFSHRLQSAKGLVSSLLIGQDVPDYEAAIRLLIWHADPDVLYLADLPDMQTVQSALTAARMGHLVIANATAPSAAQALATICDALPENSLPTFSEQLIAVTSQRLFRKSDGPGRIPAYEILQNTPALYEAIRNRATVGAFLQELTSEKAGTGPLPQRVADLIRNGAITESSGKEALRDYPTL